MKKISYEVKVGTTTLIVIVLFIWLYSFLKGKDFLTRTAQYYTIYDQIGGLAESNPVEINGYKVGIVQSIGFVNAENGKLLVEFSVDKNFKLPRNTVAEIVPISVLGGMKVQFVYGKGPGTYSFGDTLPGRLAESLTDRVEKELLPVKDKITNLIFAIDNIINAVNGIMDADFKKDLGGTLANLNTSTESLNRIIRSKENEIGATVDNINKFSKMLSDNSSKMGRSISNLESITDTIAAADIYAAVLNLKASLEKASKMVDNLNNGKGTAGKLLTNDTLYVNMIKSLESLNVLLLDLKANPKRYVHFSVFGKRNTPPK
jgi:phospholipid/cholesterol/gamma-HCH transport system substrate-binding protein